MTKTFALSIALSVLAGGALANDTSAVLTTGGLEFVTNENVEMVSEDLFISKEEIRVTYQFRNKGDADESVLVAFPMPDIVPDHWSPVAYPQGPDDNLFEFETSFNGEPVESTLHQYAFAAGVDRSDYLRDLGVSLVPISEAAREATDGLDDVQTEELFRLGLVVPDQFDAGEGWEKHWWPAWTLKSTYTWEAVFPAGETVTVEHRYKPSVGGTVGVSFMGEPYEGYDPGTEYEKKYCTDEAFLNAIRKTMKNGEPWSAPYMESWISYILSTGSNWGGPIGTFRLTIDKGTPKNLISFCWDGEVKKIGPTTFEMTAEDFWPREEIDVLILDYQPQMVN